MPLVRTGECNQCGVCCLRRGGVMVENPMISLGEDECEFYTDRFTGDQYGHCLIFAIGLEIIERARSKTGRLITQEQIRWFLENCVEYPTAEDVEAGRVPSECSFGVAEVA